MDNEFIPYNHYHSTYDPCPPLTKYYVIPPNLYIGYQPYGLDQFSPKDALAHGTLWPAFYGPYQNPYKKTGKG